MAQLINEVMNALMLQGETDTGLIGEVESLVQAAKAELRTAGVTAPTDTDPSDFLIRQAVIFYAKANFGMDNPDAKLFDARFERLKQILAADDQTKEPTVEEVTI